MKNTLKQKPTPEMRWKTTRRRFLIGTGTLGFLGVGAYFGFRAAIPTLVDTLAQETGGGSGPTQPLLWFGVSAATGVTLHVPKGEMGQGVQSMMAQLAAEELELEPTQLKIQIADSSQGFGALHGTFGSSSTTTLYQPLRQAAANLREMLRFEAASQLGVPVSEIIALRGACFARQNPNKKLEYAKIVAAKTGDWTEPTTPAPLKPREKFLTIGRSTPRLDVPDKITGKAQYGFNARVPGMMYGAVARAPRFGARLLSGQAGEATNMPGVKKVVIDPANNFAGVVADTRSRAQKALEKLQLEYGGGSSINQAELENLVTAKAGEGVVLRSRGNVNANLGKNVFEAAYRTPLAAHAHLEPLSALVDARSDLIEVWVATQNIALEVSALELAYGNGRKILVHGMQMGGSFGRKGNQTAVLEAARLSQAAGVPVHVGWTRTEEMQHSFYRQPSHAVLRGNVNNTGRIVALEHTVASGDILTGPFDPGLIGPILETGYQLDPGVLTGLFGWYDTPNYRVHSRLVTLPVPTGLWRGLGLFTHVFALESFIDELAAKAKIDPLEFRLQNLGSNPHGQRLRAVLEEVKTKSDWGIPSQPGIARGVACSLSSNTAVAMVAEVQIKNGQIQVTRVTVAVDPGLVVNPTGAALQAKGSVVMGLSSTLIEKITVKNGAVEQSNFDDYALLRLEQTPPRIDVHFVDSGLDPQGMGEPVIGPVAASIANAVFALTGQRLRELPLKLQA
jgi:isoquinoline 1-oxidoreductase subunit beta